jgi:hypothetical protein
MNEECQGKTVRLYLRVRVKRINIRSKINIIKIKRYILTLNILKFQFFGVLGFWGFGVSGTGVQGLGFRIQG